MTLLRAVIRVLAVALFTVTAPLSGQDGHPLPDSEPFFADVRQNLADAQARENVFAYKERRTELHTNPFGRIGTGAARVYDVVPSVDGTVVHRRLVERDGMPVVNAPVERVERRGRNRPRSRATLEDVVGALDFSIDRREMLDGRPMIVVRFSPRPSAKPKTREGKMAHAFEGQIWVNESAREVEKVEARAVESLSFGLGFVARLGEGTTVSLTREPVGEFWMPTSMRLTGTGRAMVFRKLTLDFAVDWFDYRKPDGG
ncbi:MAG: hypothetical protein ABL993_05430 [Vicinamibacterales bacterium]